MDAHYVNLADIGHAGLYGDNTRLITRNLYSAIMPLGGYRGSGTLCRGPRDSEGPRRSGKRLI